MRTIFYFCLLVAATGFHGLDAMGPPPRPSGGPPRPSGRPPGPPAPPGNKGTTADYGWTDDDYDENEGWVSCGCHDAPSCRKCGTQQHLCNGDCSWSYGGCYRKGPRPTNPGPRPTRPPHPPTGETPVSMPSRPPPTWETPVSIPGSRPPPTYETPVHIGTSTPGPGGNGTSTEATDAAAAAAVTGAAAATTAALADDAIMTRVKGYIDAGTCGSVSSTSNCGSSATSYFKSFTYKGKNVVISSQVPDHPAEHDMLKKNPNTRCERWQYIQLPLEPTKGSSSSATSLGTVGLAVTGGAFFNDLASPQGAIAFANEVISLDSCFGHSANGGSYHYHANINCTDAGAAKEANDPSKCVLIGYYNDGVPVYGFCKDSKEKQFTSCFKIKDGVTTSTVQHVSGSYSGIGATESDYTYDTAAFTAGTCNLDIANGAVHPTTGKYSYFVTTGFPWVPKNYFGKEGTSSLCSAA